MTTEKAIEFGKIFLKSIENEKGSATYEFVETAVKMMEKEPCEDVISRKAVLDSLVEYMDAFYNENGRMMYSDHIITNADCNDLKEWIRSFPPVTPQPKMGHWIDKFGGEYRCSCCREIISIDTEIEFPNGITYKYCPNCGCRMEGSE
jgi:hypothetical protein